MADVEQEFVTVKQAADIANVTPWTIRQWIGRKRLRSTQPGSTGKHARGGAPHRIALADLRALLASAPQPSETP